MSLLSQAIVAASGMPAANTRAGAGMRKKGVERTAEFNRIEGLPRRIIRLDDVPDLTPAFIRTPPRCNGCRLCKSAPASIWPVQSAALWEIEANAGLIGIIGAGNGKTLVDLLAVDAADAKCCVILVKPDLRAQMLAVDIPQYSRHFKISIDRIHVVAYTTLSSGRGADILDELKPDLIVADEAHCLAYLQSYRTKRFKKYFDDNIAARLVALTGTITRRSIRDYAHLCELALGLGSPLPRPYVELVQWAEAIDEPFGRMGAGVLAELCEGGESTRDGYRRRLIESPGILSVEGADKCAASLVVAERTGIKVPAAVEAMLRDLHLKWKIDDEVFEDALALARYTKQVSAGFFLKWIWPNKKKDQEWIDARAAWHKACREFLKHRSRWHLDAYSFLKAAARRWHEALTRGYVDCEECTGEAGHSCRACKGTGRLTNPRHFEDLNADLPRWACPEWIEWQKVAARFHPTPPVETVWIDKFLVEDSLAWAKKAKAGIIWYEHPALGAEIAKQGRFPFYGAGEKASATIIHATPDKQPIIVASIRAHGTGKNLQAYSRALVTTPPSGGLEWQQMLARQHRPGLEADEARFDVNLHTDELLACFDQAISDAEYRERTTGQREKLNYATRIIRPRRER